MRPKQSDYIEITVHFDSRELQPIGDDSYVIKWIGGDTKVITRPSIIFSVLSMPQALNDVAVISALNPFVKSINLKKL